MLHLDLENSDAESLELAKFAKNEGVLRKFTNVMVIESANLVTSKGPTMIAILLKRARIWDWFINLGASDYPLIPQDGLFSNISSATLSCTYLFLINNIVLLRT